MHYKLLLHSLELADDCTCELSIIQGPEQHYGHGRIVLLLNIILR